MTSLLKNNASSGDIFREEWGKAHPTVLSLLNQNPVQQSEWQDLFTSVYNIHSWVEQGSDSVRKALTDDIQDYVHGAEKRILAHPDDSSLLREYITEWRRFFTQTDILPLPFKAIDSVQDPHSTTGFVRRLARPTGEQEKTIRQVMLLSWSSRIFSSIGDRLLAAAMRLIHSERAGEIFDAQLVIGVRQSYVALNESAEDRLEVYRKTFEKTYIEETIGYYKSRAGQYLSENGVQNYMAYADRKLEEEEARARIYLHPALESARRLTEACVGVLVVECEEQLLAECAALVHTNQVDKLKMLYRLIKRTPTGIDHVLTVIDDHIRTEGLNDMKANAESITTDPEKYVQQLLSMYERFSALVRDGFYDDPRLLTARDKAFREVVNDTSVFRLELGQGRKGRSSIESKCPELLANFCDLLLRKTTLSKRLTSEQIDHKLNQLLLVLKYVSNKDVFMRFHKAHLSRRLVLDMSADQEKEEAMVTRLRECGMPAEHVTKLFRMLQDIEVNKDLNASFKKQLGAENNNKSIADAINIKVLNAGAWGRGGAADRVRVSLPRIMEDFVPEVEQFYKKQHNGRKLHWLHHWSTGTITFGTRSGGRFDLDVTTFQMAVLFCWNDRPDESMSLETLRMATELPDTELTRTLFSLVAFPRMKSQLLLCDCAPASPKDFSPSTMFRLNHAFVLVKNGKEQQRGKLSLIGRLQLSMEPQAKQEHDEIVALRGMRVQEAVVKIMKMRKQMTSAQLQTELIEVLAPMFVPSRQLIKEQLDWLIDNGFIDRRKDDMNTFVYLT